MNLKARFSLISLMFKRRSIKEIVKRILRLFGDTHYMYCLVLHRETKKVAGRQSRWL